jgi:hypothetical protein
LQRATRFRYMLSADVWNDISKFDSVSLGLAATAPVVVALFALLLGFEVPPVREWFWPTPTTNVAEAAAIGDRPRVRALAAEGAPLNVPMPVRPDILRDAPPELTAVEAAVRAGNDPVVALLLELGVRPPPDEAHRLYCLATGLEEETIAEQLREALQLSADSCNSPGR